MDPNIDPTTTSDITPDPARVTPTLPDDDDADSSDVAAPQPSSGQPSPQVPRPTSTPQSQPSSPATAPARIFPPSAQVHGVLGTLAMGALAATAAAANKTKGPLTKIAGKIGQGLGNFARNSPEGRQIQATRLAQQEGNQRMQLAQRQDQREGMKSMDEHTQHLLEYNNALLTNHHLVAQARNEDQADMDAQIDLANNFSDAMEKQGIDISTDHGAGHGGISTQDVKDAVQGNTAHIYNGETGTDAGVGILNTADLNQPLLHDIQLPMKMAVNPDTGKLEGTDVRTIKANGHNTVADVYKIFSHVQREGVQAQTDFDKQQDNMKKAADAQKAKNDVDKEPKPDKIDPIAASIGGEPAKNAQGQWSFNGKLYPDQKSANAAYGNAYEDKKLVENKAGRPESYADVVVGLHGTDRVDDATKVYTQAASANQSLQDAIKEGQDGNQVANSIATLGGALTITTSSGVHRINTTEVSQFAGANGVSWATQINQWLDRGAKGQVPPEIAQDWQNIAKMYQQNTYDAYVTHSQAIAANNGLNPAKVFVSTPDGKDEVPLSQAVAARHARAAQPQQPKVSTTRPPNVSPQATLMAVPGGQPTWIEPANMQAARAAGAKAVTQ